MDKTMKIAIILTALDKLSDVVDHAVSKSQKRITGLQKGLNSFGNKALLGGAVGAAFLGESINAAEESEIANNRLRQVFKSMGQDYVKATDQGAEYASMLQRQIGIEDEVILGVEAKLATFRKASDANARASGIFQRATKAAFDLQATGIGDASTLAIQLGKALQDPIKGLNGLGRAGIKFTDGEKKKIQTLVETGKTFQAQDLIMRSIEKRTNNVAAVTATKASKMKVAWSEVQEKIGGALLPTFQRMADKIIDLLPKIEAFIGEHPEIVKWVGLATVGLIGLGVTAKILVPVISALSWTYGVAGTALKLFGITVNTTNKLMMTTGIILIITAIAIAAYLIIKNWAKVKAFFIGLWNGVKMVFTSAWNFIKNLFLKYTPGGLIIRNWSKITAFFRGLWENVKGIFTGVWEWITGLAGRFWQAGKNIVVSIWNGIKAMINKPIEAVKNMVKKIRNLLPFSPAKEGPLKDIHRIKLVETIAASINASPMIKAMRGVVGDVANYGGSGLPSISRTNNHRSNFHLTYAPVVNGGSKADISAELRKHSKEIAGIVEEQMRKRDRTKF
jgi:hypothetical protein